MQYFHLAAIELTSIMDSSLYNPSKIWQISSSGARSSTKLYWLHYVEGYQNMIPISNCWTSYIKTNYVIALWLSFAIQYIWFDGMGYKHVKYYIIEDEWSIYASVI